MILMGTVIGDMLGSLYEFNNFSGSPEDLEFFPAGARFTDDTVLTCAVAQALLNARTKAGNVNAGRFAREITPQLQTFARNYPLACYGARFETWIRTRNPSPYGSFGNGAAMRVSPCAWAARSLSEAQSLAAIATAVTHNHPLGMAGAEAVVTALWMRRKGKSETEIRRIWRENYAALGELKPLSTLWLPLSFDETCQGTVAIAVETVLESSSFEACVRKAMTLGGDSDTIAAIAGSIFEGRSEAAEALCRKALALLPSELKSVIKDFNAAFFSEREQLADERYCPPKTQS